MLNKRFNYNNDYYEYNIKIKNNIKIIIIGKRLYNKHKSYLLIHLNLETEVSYLKGILKDSKLYNSINVEEVSKKLIYVSYLIAEKEGANRYVICDKTHNNTINNYTDVYFICTGKSWIQNIFKETYYRFRYKNNLDINKYIYEYRKIINSIKWSKIDKLLQEKNIEYNFDILDIDINKKGSAKKVFNRVLKNGNNLDFFNNYINIIYKLIGIDSLFETEIIIY